nr:unnamed protein product [Callosobruchus analis]
MSCFIIDKITGNLPDFPIHTNNWNIPCNIKLADPTYNKPGKIDILIGADVFWQLLCVGQLNIGSDEPLLQKTRLGWVVAGFNNSESKISKSSCHLSQIVDIQKTLSQFWEVEEVSSTTKPMSLEEKLCEQHFSENLQLSPTGKYVVSIPFKDDINTLGDSRHTAEKRFLHLEKRLLSNPTMRKLYIDFMREYEDLGHMTKVTGENIKPDYFMPHHGVLKENSLTTKLRTVFNASSPSTTGVSLNSLQMVGPILQPDLLAILLSFRFHEIVLSSDIKMMYRMVLINPDQRHFQKIIWRESPDQPISVFQLNTVTYGTASGSFLAIRSLFQVANEVEDKFPGIAKIIRTNMYVDDLLTGAKSVDHVQQICSQIYDILNSRGFQLRKWRSNRPETIQQFSDTSESKSLVFSLNKEHEFKTLGLSWNSENDSLNYKIHPNKQTSGKVTKRIILSKIASIFDPLGLLGPCIILAKILLQKLWLEKLTWDESLPYNLHQRWLEFSSQMNSLNSLHIPRKVTCNDAVKFELHAFSDASDQAYGACVFIKSLNARGECSVNLLCAKSKVAPLKTLTMPRLELCAALTLARMVSKISESVEIKFEKIYCWSDSSIVLAWLRTSPSLLKPFVDSRVAEIQKLTESFVWKHVSTKDNPADLLSRGVRPEAIQDCALWWFGPTWLKSDQDLWPNPQHLISDLPELRKTLKVVIIDQNVINFERFSSLARLKRSFAYLLRFIKNSKEPKPERHLGHLSTSEINDAFHSLIRISQLLSFPSDYQRLKEGNNLSSSSRILSLSPFMDRDGLIRVGGRLKNSNLPYCRKHPILLNSSHHLTKLIIRKAHLDLLHAGTEQVLSHVRETFWPISGRSVVRQVVKKCVTCAKFSTKIVQPVMGNLPALRVTPDFPFSKVGVDYCGPFLIKGKRGRGSTSSKCWIALFVCFVTRAIHLELVTSLTTEAFMQTLKRFMGRRGKPNDLYSDNGTNFVGASREIGRFLKGNNAAISEGASNLNISWHFIPANSPHFGGIWEANIKSTKFHLRKVMGNCALTFEELYTLLVQIEAVLNSRPLHPLSVDPNDLTALTPAHFLIGRPLLTTPEPDLTAINENRVTRYQHLQRLHQHFWSRWSKNYLSELQQRRKWKMTNGDITIGQLVLIRDDHLPPMKWRLGRVDSMIVGSDGLSRVARIKTAEGIFSRAINRLCPLPIESTDFQPRAHVHDNHVPESGTPDSTTATPPGERETTKKTDIESKPAHRSI